MLLEYYFVNQFCMLVQFPIGAISTYSNKIFNTMLNHYSVILKRNLNLSEIFEKNLHLGWTNEFFLKKKIRLIKFRPTEILKFTKEVVKIINNNDLFLKINMKKNLKKFIPKN